MTDPQSLADTRPRLPRYTRSGLWATCTLLVGFLALPVPAQRTPLAHVTVSERNAFYHQREHLTFGVPFARGVLPAPESLRIWRQDGGAALPIQTRSLSLWQDGSARWVLVDTQLELQSREQVVLTLGLAKDIEPTESHWMRGFGLPGGKRRPCTQLLADESTHWTAAAWPESGVGSVLGLHARLVDRFGHEYLGVLDASSGQTLEQGPLRFTRRYRGAHRKSGDEGLEIDFHTFTVTFHLLAGTGTARVEWSLENGPLHDPPGRLAFRSYELLLDTDGPTTAVDLPTGMAQGDIAFELRQDGSGEGGGTARVDGKDLRLPGADDLWAGVLGPEDTATYVHRMDSAHNHPAALSRQPDGSLILGLLPPTPGELFFLDDATQKTFRLTLARDAGRAGRELMRAAAEPPYVALDPEEVAASGAWGDTGVFYLPDSSQLRHPVSMPKQPKTGWADWGEFYARNTHTTGSPRNRLSVFLEAIQSGRADLFHWSQVRSWHAMDLRPFHIQGFRADEYPEANLYEGIPHSNEPPHKRLGRSEMAKRFPEYKVDLPAKGHAYNGFDPEHMTVDDIYECYLLTGSWVAYDALVSVGEAMRTWKYLMPGGSVPTSRVIGWTLRALVQVYRATGDPKLMEAAALMVSRADAARGKGEVKYLSPHAPGRHPPVDKGDDTWMVAFAVYGLAAYWNETGDPAVPPMLADLSSFMLSGYRGIGFVGCLPIDDAGFEGKPHGAMGTSQWIPGALATAAAVTGDYGPVDAVFHYYTHMHAKSSRPTRFGSETWSFWQPYLEQLQRRHGYRAVMDPAAFDMPGKGSR